LSMTACKKSLHKEFRNKKDISILNRYKSLAGLICVVFLFLYTPKCIGQQNSLKEHGNLFHLVNNKVDSMLGNDFLLMNARFLIHKYPGAKGNPYFETTSDAPGKLTLDKKEYNNITLLYDIYDQKLSFAVEKTGNYGTILELNNQVISRFHLDNKNFVNSCELAILPQTGFYEEIFLGKHLKVYSRWSKEYTDMITDENIGEFSLQKRRLFFVVDGKRVDVSSKHGFLKIFAGNSNQIKSFLWKKKIRFSKSDNAELRKLFEYTDSILN
jgi:hypothetical protein